MGEEKSQKVFKKRKTKKKGETNAVFHNLQYLLYSYTKVSKSHNTYT